MKPTLGSEIKRLRLEAGFSLRKFAEAINKSPPYQSDIEHDRRMPSETTLRDMVNQLKHVGATYEGFTRNEPNGREGLKQLGVATTPQGTFGTPLSCCAGEGDAF